MSTKRKRPATLLDDNDNDIETIDLTEMAVKEKTTMWKNVLPAKKKLAQMTSHTADQSCEEGRERMATEEVKGG